MGSDDTKTVEAAVSRAWVRVIGADSLARQEEFDAAGGDSLAFLRLIHFIELDLGREVPLGSVRMSDAPHDLAAAIAAIQPDPHPGAATTEDERPVVFMVPVSGGDGPGQARLRAHCAPWLDMRMVRLPEWTRIMRQDFGFESLCDSVADQVDQDAGTDPILLTGYCFGGAVASVVARKLLRRGRKVAYLGLIDADLAWFRRASSRQGQSIAGLDRLRSVRRAWEHGRMSEHIAWQMAELLEQRGRGLLRWVARGNPPAVLPESFRFHLNLYLQMVLLPRVDRAGLIRLMSDDHLTAIPTTVFRTSHHTPDRPDDLGWSELFSPVEVAVIQGDHDGVFDPETIGPLGDQLVASVQRAIQRPPAYAPPVRNPVAIT